MAERRTKKQIANDAHRALWCTVDVCSLKVNVYLVDRTKFADVMQAEDGTPAVGIWIADMCAIFIGWDLPHSLAENTLLHEMKHARNYALGLPDNEDDVNAQSSADYDTYKRNGFLRFPTRPVTPEDRRNARKAKK